MGKKELPDLIRSFKKKRADKLSAKADALENKAEALRMEASMEEREGSTEEAAAAAECEKAGAESAFAAETADEPEAEVAQEVSGAGMAGDTAPQEADAGKEDAK